MVGALLAPQPLDVAANESRTTRSPEPRPTAKAATGRGEQRARPGPGWREGNPWADAPMHLIQLLTRPAPAGASDASMRVASRPGRECARGAARRIWTMPRGGGRSRRVRVGLRGPVHAAGAGRDRGRRATGPYLYVGRPDSATRRGCSRPGGRVWDARDRRRRRRRHRRHRQRLAAAGRTAQAPDAVHGHGHLGGANGECAGLDVHHAVKLETSRHRDASRLRAAGARVLRRAR